MIRNERQYRITKARVHQFRDAREELEQKYAPASSGGQELRWKVQRDAINSQIQDLADEINAYESLRAEAKPIEVSSLEEIPMALIQARISAGMTQRELAEKLSLREQQIQRYEATDYRGVSIDRISAIMNALGIQLRQGVLLPSRPIRFDAVLEKLAGIGFNRDFVFKKLVPSSLRAHVEDGDREVAEAAVLQTVARTGRVLGIDTNHFFLPGPLALDDLAVSAARFKIPANFSVSKLTAYAVYAHYLALLVLQATPHLPTSRIPASWKHIRRQIIGKYQELDLETIVNYCWDIGIPVLPLNDPAAFHGATWRVRGRNIIVVKQRTRSEARWMTDIFHELWHAAQNPDLTENAFVEDDPRSAGYATSIEEEIATDFAADILLAGKAEELALECARASSQRMEWLKNTVLQVSKRYAVREDILANYLAYRLSMEDQDWWATASTLQRTKSDPWRAVRDIMISRLDWGQLSPHDRDLLQSCLSSKG
jgi:transcriptional regulator with XRE-family HTH domain/Zn-dependent peptidase ImmA (M78 family)